MMARKTHEEAEAALHDQTQLLPRPQLIFVLCIMAIALMVCFIDQNGIGVLLPTISRDLHAQSSITWAGTAALIANTVSILRKLPNLSHRLSCRLIRYSKSSTAGSAICLVGRTSSSPLSSFYLLATLPSASQ
jgi:p-aminobenzoyl-glutamate transporter AbgT